MGWKYTHMFKLTILFMLRRLFSSTGFECLGWQTGGEEAAAAGWPTYQKISRSHPLVLAFS